MGVPEAKTEIISAPLPEAIQDGCMSVQGESLPTPAEKGCDITEKVPVDPHAKLGVCCSCSGVRSILFSQCGHMLMCEKCGDIATMCPLCNEPVTQRIAVCWS